MNCHSFRKNNKYVNLFGHSIQIMFDVLKNATKRTFCVQRQPEKETAFTMVDEEEEQRKSEILVENAKMMDYNKQLFREVSAHSVVDSRGEKGSVNCAALFSIPNWDSIQTFLRKYPTSYLLFSLTFFRWRRLFFVFIFRHVPLVCTCRHTSLKTNGRLPLT